jgi:hypothetical protein
MKKFCFQQCNTVRTFKHQDFAHNLQKIFIATDTCIRNMIDRIDSAAKRIEYKEATLRFGRFGRRRLLNFEVF